MRITNDVSTDWTLGGHNSRRNVRGRTAPWTPRTAWLHQRKAIAWNNQVVTWLWRSRVNRRSVSRVVGELSCRRPERVAVLPCAPQQRGLYATRRNFSLLSKVATHALIRDSFIKLTFSFGRRLISRIVKGCSLCATTLKAATVIELTGSVTLWILCLSQHLSV